MKRLLVLLFAFFLAACTNDPEPDEKGGSGKISDLTLLVVQDDSISTTAFPFTYDLSVTSGGQPLTGADITLQIDEAEVRSIGHTNTEGKLRYSVDALTNAVGEFARLRFTATRTGFDTSVAIRHIRLAQSLLVSVADTTSGEPGMKGPLGILISVSAGAAVIPNAIIKVVDEVEQDTVTLLAINGTATFEYYVRAYDSVKRFTATASKKGYTSGAKSFYIKRVPRKPVIGPIAVNSRSSTSIAYLWDATENYQGPYEIAIYEGSSKVQDFTTTDTFAVVTGLKPDKLYTIGIAIPGQEEVRMEWATAKRLPFESDGTQTIRLWEIDAQSVDRPSGVTITANGIRAVSTRSADSSQIDFVLGSNTSSQIPVTLLAPGVQGSSLSTGKRTIFSPANVIIPGGLDQYYIIKPLSFLFVQEYNALDIWEYDFPEMNSDLIVPIILVDDNGANHYARMGIVSQPSGQPFGFENGNAFIDIRVSYQTLANAAYASRPRAQRRNEPRCAASTPRR